jgi:tripartite-type tricarboxylate transporter receptor subunit TctC
MIRSYRWLFCAILLAVASAANAQSWPSRPIKLIVPSGPGSASDVIARLTADSIARALGQPMIVENQAGASGIVAHQNAARAAPDGYTLVVASGVVLVNPSVGKVAYDPIKDFAPVAFLGYSPNMLLTRPDSGIRTVQDLIAKAKANPGKINFSSPGVGSVSQLAVELLKLRANIELVHVPYSGAAPAAQAAAAGTVEIASVAVAGMMGPVQGGALRAIAQTGSEEWSELPGVPTMAQSGVPDAVVETTQMLLAPAGTPQPIIDRLAKEVLAIMNKPDVRDRMLKASFAVRPEGPQALAARIAREVPMWKDLVDKAGIRIN